MENEEHPSPETQMRGSDALQAHFSQSIIDQMGPAQVPVLMTTSSVSTPGSPAAHSGAETPLDAMAAAEKAWSSVDLTTASRERLINCIASAIMDDRGRNSLRDAAITFRCPEGFEALSEALEMAATEDDRGRLDDALKAVILASETTKADIAQIPHSVREREIPGTHAPPEAEERLRPSQCGALTNPAYLREKAEFAEDLGYRDHANLLRDAADTIAVLSVRGGNQ